MKRPARARAGRAGAGFDPTPYLAAVMRHELFGALNAISMTAGLLSERARKGKIELGELGQMAARLAKQIERSTRIVDQYLDLVGPRDESGREGARALAGTDDSRCATLADLEHALAAASSEQPQGRTVEVAVGFAAGERKQGLALQPAALHFAIGRVLHYAASHTESSTVQVSVQVAQEDEEVVVEIGHGGGALTIDDLHVFERGPRKVHALLLDLAVVRRVLTDAGGELAPRAGGFLIRIPLAEE
ncbi:MAG TPA: hypothetical protein VKN99_20995 [Polyangia bacterium]|nr:hypothetical protein [Polyangia bacterium]